MTRRPGIRALLLATNVFVFAMPLLAIVGLRVFDDQLIRRTEAQLIAEAVLIGEAYREAWTTAKGLAPRPATALDPLQVFTEPRLSFGAGVLPATPDPTRFASDRSGPAWAAGRRIEAVLRRAAPRNLSSARVLGPDGCVVASSGAGHGSCLDDLPEVQRALAGDYAAALRDRTREAPDAALGALGRRGRVRVHVAMPVRQDDGGVMGGVIGVVRMSRTALDPAKALWFDRRRLLVALLVCTGVAALVSLLLSRTLSRPLRAVTAAARATARGEPRQPIATPRIAAAELVEMSRAVDRMGEQLVRRADYIAGFASHASHELKTPIAAIRGATELLEQDWRGMTDAERNGFIRNIAADARRMESLVAGMLELARIENATEPDEAIDPRPVLRAVAERFGGCVRLDLGALPERVQIRAAHLDSAISNLVDNAIRHGRGPVTVEAATGPDGRAAIRVRDRGPGISPGNRARIYDRFFTTARDHGGTGLGLCIARAVAERVGGRLDCESGPHGTCFEFVV